jgi:hypothetical protein
MSRIFDEMCWKPEISVNHIVLHVIDISTKQFAVFETVHFGDRETKRNIKIRSVKCSYKQRNMIEALSYRTQILQ